MLNKRGKLIGTTANLKLMAMKNDKLIRKKVLWPP